MSERPLTRSDIKPEYRHLITRQDYLPSPRIEGVRLVELKQFRDDGGTFIELGRLDEAGLLLGLDDFKVRQVNFSELLPGAVKAWHLHFDQEDVWFVPPGERMLVGLKDLRANSPTCGNQMRFTMGGGSGQLLFLPRGVAHGAANPWTNRSFMFYLVNQHFSTQETDEYRLSWDAFGADFWLIEKG